MPVLMMNIRSTKLLLSKKRARSEQEASKERDMTPEEVIKKALRGEITWIEAEGAQGLLHSRTGKPVHLTLED